MCSSLFAAYYLSFYFHTELESKNYIHHLLGNTFPMLRLKKKKKLYVSELVACDRLENQWAMCFFLTFFFFYRQQKCQVLVGHNCCPSLWASLWLVTDWKNNAACVFFCFCFFLIVGKSAKFQLVITFVQCEIWNLIVGWTRYETKSNQEHGVQEVCYRMCFLCLSYLLMYILGSNNTKIDSKL